MRIPRIFVPVNLSSGRTLALPEQAANHVARVLRLRPGAELILFDGQGGEYRAVLSDVTKRDVLIEVGDHFAHDAESPLSITLGQGVSKGERMDYTIQKAVELGITRVDPLMTERTVVNLNDERRERRLQHWQGVAVGACEQCGRNVLPEVAPTEDLAHWLARPHVGLKLVLYHRGARRLGEFSRPEQAVTLLIGPEGGLSEREIAMAQDAGFQPLCLGPRILRTETAAVMALAAMQVLWGDAG